MVKKYYPPRQDFELLLLKDVSLGGALEVYTIRGVRGKGFGIEGERHRTRTDLSVYLEDKLFEERY